MMKVSYYWSLTVEPEWVQAAVWSVVDEEKKATVLSFSPPMRWESEEELVDVADSALSAAIQKLDSDDIEPTKTVFGLMPSWIEDGQIHKDHVSKIKELCSKLALEPYGFVVLPEAIAYYIKSSEGSPLSAVLVGVGNETIDISYFKLGNLAGSVSVVRSVTLAEDVIEGLTRFSMSEPFPSRFMLYDGKAAVLEEAKEILTSYDWINESGEHVKFLHTPKIEIIDSVTKIVAVSLAGASETGDIKEILVEGADEEGASGTDETAGILTAIPGEDGVSQNITSEDVANVDDGVLTAEEVGFAVGADVKPIHNKVDGEPTIHGAGEEEAGVERHARVSPFSKVGALFSGIGRNVGGVFKRKEKKLNVAGDGSTKRMLLSLFLLLLIIGGLIGAWVWLPKSNVTVYVAPRRLEQVETVTLDSNATSVNVSDKVIPGKQVKREVSGDKTRSTTGTKTVGERAKGTVEIRNGTTSDVQLDAGETITGPNNLKFTLDGSASVAAKSSPTTPGTEEVSVTASEFGSEYNLAEGETFSVSNYPKSDVDAVAVSDFTGGSSREISAVSEDDLTQLEEDLISELRDKGIEEIKNALSSEEELVEDSIESEATSTEFSHKEGDETSTLKLEAAVEVSGLVASRSDLEQYAKQVLQERTPEGFILREDQVEMDFEVVESENGTAEVEVSFVANLLPDVQPDSVIENIAGKPPTVAQEYLTTIPGYTRAEVKLSPRFPSKLGTLPYVKNHIEVEIAADR